MEEQIEAILKFHMPRWNELPDIDLYLDQVVNYIERYIRSIFHKQRRQSNNKNNDK